MLDLVPYLDQELEVSAGTSGHWALRLAEAVPEFPVLVRPVGCLLDLAALPKAVIDACAPEPSMEKVCPSDDGRGDEDLSPESQAGAVEGVDGRDHCLARLNQQLVSPVPEPGLGIEIGPYEQEGGHLLFGGRAGRAMLSAQPDLADLAVVDCARRSREMRQDLLIIVASSREHPFDDRDLPPLQLSLDSSRHRLSRPRIRRTSRSARTPAQIAPACPAPACPCRSA